MEEWHLDGDDVPMGKAICIVNVLDCRPMTKEDEPGACCRLYDGAWAWELELVQSVKPFNVLGKLRFFEVEDSLVAAHRHEYGCDCEVQECRICGCTDYDCQDCIERTGDACTWAEEDLCSACVDLKCNDCGKPAEGIYYLPDDKTESGFAPTPYCSECAKGSYCPGCHHFWAGTNEFDRNGGWCDNCKSEIDEPEYDPELDFGFFED